MLIRLIPRKTVLSWCCLLLIKIVKKIADIVGINVNYYIKLCTLAVNMKQLQPNLYETKNFC